MTSNIERDERVNKTFDDKKAILRDMAEKNAEQIKKIQRQLPSTIENLQTDVDSLEISELQDFIKTMKAKEMSILEDLKNLYGLLDFVNMRNKNKDNMIKNKNLNVEDILSATSEDQTGYNKLKTQFVKIGQLSKNVEQKINEFNNE